MRRKKIKEEKVEQLTFAFDWDELTIAQPSEGEQGKKWTNDNVVRNLSLDQREILHNIIEMHNNGEPFECDITASEMQFYRPKGKFVIPEPKYLFDVYPQRDDIVKIEPDGRIPLEDNSVSSVVCDLPFVVSTPIKESNDNDGACLIFKRFHGYYPVYNLYWSYAHWLSECYRILKDDGILIWKCQNTVSGGKFYATEEFSWQEAEKLGFYTLDKFTLAAKARLISGKVKTQQHARNYLSVFWVFKKNGRIKTIDYYGLINKAEQKRAEGKSVQIVARRDDRLRPNEPLNGPQMPEIEPQTTEE